MKPAPALLALALLSGCSRAPSAPAPLVPGLAERLPALADVRLEHGGETLVFERDGDDWRIRDAAWRADRRWLQPLLLGLANARCDEARTADPSRFARIGVAWPAVAELAADGAFARPTGRLTVSVDGRDVAVIIGYPQARGGTFVRVEGASNSCLSAASLRLPARAAEWFDPQLWRLPIEDVVAVVVEDTDARPLRLVARDGRFIAEGALVAPTPFADALASAMATPRQVDRRAAGDTVPQRVLRLERSAGEPYALALWREGGTTWARVVAAPPRESAWYASREFRLPDDVAEPLWAGRAMLGGP